MYVEKLEELITLQSKEFLDTSLGRAFLKFNFDYKLYILQRILILVSYYR